MEPAELELTGYIVVAWRSADPLDKAPGYPVAYVANTD